MASIGKVSAVFTASTSGLTAGVKQASSSFRALQADTQGLASSMRSLVAIEATQLFASAASSAISAVQGLVRFGQAQADVVDNASKMASRLGMTYAEFSGLSLAADLAGVSMESIGTASQKAEIAFARAASGSKVASAAFGALGLSVADLNGLSPAERFDAIASSIAALPTEAERAAAAVQIFGRSGAALLPLFAGGAEGIAQARQEAERLGLALTDAQGQDVEAMNDSFTMAAKAIQGVVQQVVAYLAPAVTGVVEQFTTFIGDIGGANIGQAIGDGILQGAEFLAGVADWLVTNLSGVWEYVGEVAGNWRSAMDIGFRVGQAFYGAFKFLESVGNVIGAVLSSVVAKISSAAATAASVVPGLAGVTASLQATAMNASALADQYRTSATNNLVASGEAFANALSAEASAAGEAIAGPFQKTVQDFRATARTSADAVSEATSKPVEVKQTVEASGISEALRAVDSRSKEGVAEMFRLLRGGSTDVAQQQLTVLEQIAENTAAAGDPPLAVDF